jgi:hypothetical protein
MKHEKKFDAEKYIRQLIKRTKSGELTWRAVSWSTSVGEKDGSKMHVVHGYRTTDKGRRLNLCLDPIAQKYYTLSISVDKVDDGVKPYNDTQSWASVGLTGEITNELYKTVVNDNFAELIEDVDEESSIVNTISETADEELRQLRYGLWFVLGCAFVFGVLCGHFLW